MTRQLNNPLALAQALVLMLAPALTLAGCENAPETPPEQAEQPERPEQVERPAKQSLGLMTSLPIYWPLGVGFDELIAEEGAVPIQRELLEKRFEIIPLDTLSPVGGIAEGGPEADPLARLDRLAVIQPRGLAPADNVALDKWVRGGGRLLLVLDPMLTGEYDLPLGDPQRPVDTALIPPVVKRWGVSVRFDENQAAERRLQIVNTPLKVSLAGQIVLDETGKKNCSLLAEAVIARCLIGDGTVTLFTDAAVFENTERADQTGNSGQQPLPAFMDFAFPKNQ